MSVIHSQPNIHVDLIAFFFSLPQGLNFALLNAEILFRKWHTVQKYNADCLPWDDLPRSARRKRALSAAASPLIYLGYDFCDDRKKNHNSSAFGRFRLPFSLLDFDSLSSFRLVIHQMFATQHPCRRPHKSTITTERKQYPIRNSNKNKN